MTQTIDIKTEAELIPHYVDIFTEDDVTVLISRAEGDVIVYSAKINGDEVVVDGRAFDETHGREEIVIRYGLEEVVELYAAFM